jgi:DNA mismatch endonuclease (patch repair protein)
MVDGLTPAERSRRMASIKGKDTGPEHRVRRALHSLGYRYRLHVRSLPGTPDIVLARYRAVIEVRGCFWHGHSCPDGHVPKTRQGFWRDKIRRNQRRDARNVKALRGMGWMVIVVWECRIRSRNGLATTMRRIGRLLQSREALLSIWSQG